INFISQNGWTVYTPENVLTEYEGRIINSHPGPLDAPYADFGGAKMNDLVVHAAAIHFFNNVLRPFKTEINLHFVTKDFDKGEVVARREVEVYPADTPRILQQRVKVAERELLRVFWKRISLSQKIKPIKRDERVIKEGEEKSLEEAKRQAIKKWSTPPSVRS
ncbi:hypothetical protein HYS97_01465, partial [Candidatus Daviesbacteria bacterium]|nr:hypothetical protein [Candidatus Daviesbacteria bacterium]